MRKRWHKLAAIPLALVVRRRRLRRRRRRRRRRRDHRGAERRPPTRAPRTPRPPPPSTTAAAPRRRRPRAASRPDREPAGTEAGGSAPTVELGSRPRDRRLRGRRGRRSPAPSAPSTRPARSSRHSIAFGEANNIDITYTGDADWEANINTQVAGGNPPNISIFPQPGKLADFARDGSVVPLSRGRAGVRHRELARGLDRVRQRRRRAVRRAGEVRPQVASCGTSRPASRPTATRSPRRSRSSRRSSRRWPPPAAPSRCASASSPARPPAGRSPTGSRTWSCASTARTCYDQWVTHEIPFNDERIVESMQTVLDLWADENVFASSGNIVATAFQDNGTPLVDGDCYMHRQANFYGAFFPEGTRVRRRVGGGGRRLLLPRHQR